MPEQQTCFRISAAVRSLSLREVFALSDAAAFELFRRVRLGAAWYPGVSRLWPSASRWLPRAATAQEAQQAARQGQRAPQRLSGRERRGDLAHEDGQRKVPRADAGEDAAAMQRQGVVPPGPPAPRHQPAVARTSCLRRSPASGARGRAAESLGCRPGRRRGSGRRRQPASGRAATRLCGAGAGARRAGHRHDEHGGDAVGAVGRELGINVVGVREQTLGTGERQIPGW